MSQNNYRDKITTTVILSGYTDMDLNSTSIRWRLPHLYINVTSADYSACGSGKV